MFQKKTGSRNNTIAESSDGFVVELLIWNGNDSGILYREGSKAIYFDAIYPRDISKEQLETSGISKMRDKIKSVFKRSLESPPPIDVYVPAHLQWGSGIAGDKTEMSDEERNRILNNFKKALDFLELPFHFVSD